MSDALGDPDLASQMAQLSDNLRALRPGLDRGPVEHARGRRAARLRRRRRGGRRARRPRGARAAARPGPRRARPSTTSTSRPLEQHLGAGAAARPRGAARAGARARAAGLRDPRRRRAAADPARRAPARRDRAASGCSRRSRRPARGDHDDRRTGSADELTGATRPWEFGDELPIDAVRTVSNALRRGGRHPRAGCSVEDFEVVETERRTSAAVALCVDLSFSMVTGGPLGPDEADRAGAVAPGRDPVPRRTRCRSSASTGPPAGSPRCSSPTSSRTGCRAPTCSTR